MIKSSPWLSAHHHWVAQMKHTDKSLYGGCQKVRPRKKESGKVEMEDQGEK